MPSQTLSGSCTSRFSLTRVNSQEQLEAAATLRAQVFRERRQISFDDALEARRDREAHVFLLFDRARAVAVGRVLPYPSRLSSLVDLNQEAGALGADSEIGRVACVADRAAVECALILLTLGSHWLLEHTRLRRYIGYCHPKLLESYRRLGAVAGEALDVPGRADRYRMISGNYDDAATLGARLLGWP